MWLLTVEDTSTSLRPLVSITTMRVKCRRCTFKCGSLDSRAASYTAAAESPRTRSSRQARKVRLCGLLRLKRLATRAASKIVFLRSASRKGGCAPFLRSRRWAHAPLDEGPLDVKQDVFCSLWGLVPAYARHRPARLVRSSYAAGAAAPLVLIAAGRTRPRLLLLVVWVVWQPWAARLARCGGRRRPGHH